MSILTRVLLMIGLCVSALSASAQYPEKSITMVVPFEPGGTTDIIGRIVANYLSIEIGKPVIVENRSGSGGTIGSAIVARAKPDGYTLLFATAGTHSINPNLRAVPYDPITDFAPISLAAETPVLVVVNPNIGVKTLQDLVKLGKNHPKSLNFGSAGIGSISHLTGELFNQLTGAEMIHVPYRGAAPAITDVIGGRVQVFMNNLPPLVPYVQSGALRALAVASEKRSSFLPDVPTAAEAGLSGLVVAGWFGVMAPAGTPAKIVDRLHVAMISMGKSPDVRNHLNKVGAELRTSSSPAEFSQYISEELARWKMIIGKADIKTN